MRGPRGAGWAVAQIRILLDFRMPRYIENPACAFFVLACLFASVHSTAQSYPQRPIRFVIPYAPGGNTDMIGRVLGSKVTESIGQTVVVENRGGAATLIGAERGILGTDHWGQTTVSI